MTKEQREQIESLSRSPFSAYGEALRALLTAYDEAQRDAERWKWLVHATVTKGEQTEDQFNAEVDAAMRAERGKA